MKITFNRQRDATSLITKKVACVYSFIFQAPPIMLYFDFKGGRGGQMTVGSKKLRNSSMKALAAGYHTFLFTLELH